MKENNLDEVEAVKEKIFPIMVEMKGQIDKCRSLGDKWEADFLDNYFLKLAAIFPDLFFTASKDVSASRFYIEVRKWLEDFED